MAAISAIAFAIVMLILIFFGEAILNLFGVTISAFRITGDLLFLLMGIDRMRASFSTQISGEPGDNSLISISIVPLTIPILAGHFPDVTISH